MKRSVKEADSGYSTTMSPVCQAFGTIRVIYKTNKPFSASVVVAAASHESSILTQVLFELCICIIRPRSEYIKSGMTSRSY